MIEDQSGKTESIMALEIAVPEYGAPEPSETAAMMKDQLRFHTDSSGLSLDLRAGLGMTAARRR
jgi:hypothetical protein